MKRLFLTIILLGSVIHAQDQTNIENKFRLGQSYEAAGQFEKAENIYRDLHQLQPFNYTYFESLNKVLITLKKYDEAIQLVQNKIRETPQDPNMYGLLGTTYFMMDDMDNAFAAWEKGISTNPNTYITYRIIANYAIENRAYEKAIDILKRGKKMIPDLTFFSIDLANLYAVNMDFENAAMEFCELINFQPGQLGMAKSRVASYISRPLAAQQTINGIEKAISSQPSEYLYDFLVFVYQQTENYEDAFRTIEKSELEYKGNGTMAFNFAQDAFKNRHYDWSGRTFQFILSKYPDSPYKIPASIGYVKSLEENLNLESDSTIESWKPINLPKVHKKIKYEQVVKEYDHLINEYKDYALKSEALFRIGEIYRRRLLQFEEADSIYKILIEFSPMSSIAARAKSLRGTIAITKNDLDSAKNFFLDVLSQPQNDPQLINEVNYNLGRIEFWKGNFSLALQRLQNVTNELSYDFANDALEITFLISSTRKDSLNLLKYAKANYLLLQNNLKEAATEMKPLGDNDNLFIINQFAKSKLAEIFIAENDYSSAIQLLEKVLENEKTAITADKSTFLLANTYLYGTEDIEKAVLQLEKILEIYPNSIYFDYAREKLNGLKNNNGQK